MLFNSFGYLLFLLIAVPLTWLLPRRARVYLLGVASLLFYAMWRWEFVFLVLFSAAVDFQAARRLRETNNPRGRRLLLGVSLSVNLGLLIFFKYGHFLGANLMALGQGLGVEAGGGWSEWNVVLPLGISFYTFQTISYTIDAYRRVGRTTDDFLVFVAYVSFWPQLVAGPILRAAEMLPQLEAPQPVSTVDCGRGMERILIGLFKKVVIADYLASVVDKIYGGNLSLYQATDVWVATTLFGFQIYLDFSGYSDIAIGSARLVGIRIPENFSWPYAACSPREFWQRWHISLSSWIRDYLYLPLTGQGFHTQSGGGLAVAAEDGRGRRTWALFLTWFLMGLWHGAAWRFAMWGLYHAFFVYLYRRVRVLRSLSARWPLVGWGMTFLMCMAGWIPFRAGSVREALLLLAKLGDPTLYHVSARLVYGPYYLLALLLVLAFLLARAVVASGLGTRLPAAVMGGVRILGTAGMSVAVLLYLRPMEQFIYFQF